MDSHNIRLSRISHPRATLWATVLLIVVFLGFGVVAQANMNESSPNLIAKSDLCLDGSAAKH